MKERHFFIDRFMEFEEKEDLFNLKIRRIQIWPLLRFSVYSMLDREKNNIEQVRYEPSKLRKIINYVRNLFSCIFFHNPLINLHNVSFILFNHSRRILSNCVWEEPYSDRFLMKNKNKKFYIYESPYYGEHQKNVLVPENRKYQDILNIISTIFAKISVKIFPLTKEENKTIDDLQSKINNEFSSTVDISRIKYDIFYYSIYKKLLRYIIKKTNPTKIYEVVYYDLIHMMVNEVAAEMGIETYEFQHGTMGYYHISYNYLKKRDYIWFPNYVLLFNEFWKENTRLPIKEENKIIYGNPYLEAMKKEYSKTVHKNKKEIILILSQIPVGNQLSKLAIDLYNKINRAKWKIIFKLHPNEYFDWEERYPDFKYSDIEVIDNNKRHLYELFSISKIQIGVYSTAIYEGLDFGLETFILKAPGWEYMEEVILSGSAILIEKPEDFFEYIKKSDNM